ncbi:MAG: OmpA family protein [Paludibacteraceae bacterium]|nr:OmpA family protein [Paludibacteraceae bacterium]
MKAKINLQKESRIAWFPCFSIIKSLFVGALMLIGLHTTIQAQEAAYIQPSWWLGVAGGANFNFYRGSTQELNSTLTVPSTFHNGNGVGLYLAPLVEFHRPNSRWGAMLQVGYDNRNAKFNQIKTPCNCPADLDADISYITVEPSLRFAPFKSDLYLYAGPRLAVNVEKSFDYQLGTNPAYVDQVSGAEVKGDFSNVEKTILSMQVGAGYDIHLSSKNKRTQFVLSPFVSYHPYFGQNPRSIETLNITTLRVGAAFKFGVGHKVAPQQAQTMATLPVAAVIVKDSTVNFSVNSPTNIPVERRVRETFPLRNYVFFDLGSTEIPKRYILLSKGDVKTFKENQMEVLAPKRLSGRSEREMNVYHNILNILGDRMNENPSATIVLVGSSEKGPKDGKEMAESIKHYLVTVFDIDASRISIEGRYKPKIPSEQPGGTKELDLLRQGDRRVSIESSSPALLMEFQSGQEAPLKPIELVGVEEAPLDSYVTFYAKGATEGFSSWSLDIKDENGVVQHLGPYTEDSVSIPGKSILGNKTKGDYKVTMIGRTKSGKTVTQETSVSIVLWTPPENEEMMRFSIIYEFNNSKAIYMYEKYLSNVVTPKIQSGATVIIHGHTDIIGDSANNKRLSVARANDVKVILEKSMAKAKITDVNLKVYGFGADKTFSTFENNLPEERFYNRTVIVDIIPRK